MQQVVDKYAVNNDLKNYDDNDLKIPTITILAG